MFVYVRLIDSQEHQYPNKKPDPNIQEKPKTKSRKTTGQQTGYPRSKEKPRKNQCSEKPGS
jgi:5-methylcytosine-specific restriction endonuclease McrA